MAVVTIALLGVMCGSDDWVAVAEYGRCKAQWLSEFLPLENGIPSSHTFRRVFAVLDPAALESCMLAWMQALVKITNGKLVAVDGKSLRRSFARGWDKSGMTHIVSMFVQANRQVLSQIQCDGKGQEIDAIMHLLKLVDVTGAVVTIDALGCQTAIAEKVVESQADYVLAAKDNQKTLADGVTSVMQELILDHDKKREAPVDYFEQTQEGHGRKETRKVWVSTAVQRLPATIRGKWTGLASIAVVERTRQDYGDFTGKVSVERCCYISSLKSVSATAMAGYIRGHWSVENSLHWQLDMSFQEDQSRLRQGHGAQNMSRLRRIALNLAKANGAKIGVKSKRMRAGWDNQYLLDLLAGGRTPERGPILSTTT